MKYTIRRIHVNWLANYFRVSYKVMKERLDKHSIPTTGKNGDKKIYIDDLELIIERML